MATAKRGGREGVIDRQGKVVLPFEYHRAEPVAADRFLVETGEAGELSGVMDGQKHWVLPLAKQKLRKLKGSRCRFFSLTDRTAFDGDGKVLFKTEFLPMNGDFEEGLCAMYDPEKKRHCHYIDEEGKRALEPPKEVTSVDPFHNGLAWARQDSRHGNGHGLINKKGDIVFWLDLGTP